MKPIAVFQFSPTEGPARFGHWLDAQGWPWELIAIDARDPVPVDASAFAGVGLMGGPMSVYEPLPWLGPMHALLRDAVARGVPVIGHCLGGQLLAQALGASVRRAEMPEVGWIDVEATDPVQAHEWLGGRSRFTAFQWHYDAFDVPRGATPILTNRWNAHQGYVLEGRHLGLQCHVEMTRALVESWCDTGADELPSQDHDAQQSRTSILRDLDARLAALCEVSTALYLRWAQGLRH